MGIQMQKPFYLDALERESNAMGQAARQQMTGPAPAVPSCPGWTMNDLVLHMGAIYRLVANRITNREREFVRYDTIFTPDDWTRVLRLDPEWVQFAAEGKVPEYHAMPSTAEGKDPEYRSMPSWLIAWFSEGAERLQGAFRSVDPDEPIGTWWPPNQHAGFWMRRMAHETAVHRWDAQNAVGAPEPIERDLASDGVDEMMEVIIPDEYSESKATPNGESYHFHQSDGEGEWMIYFEPSELRITRDHSKADVELAGTASDLLLFLLGRVPVERLAVSGASDLIPRYFELVPSF